MGCITSRREYPDDGKPRDKPGTPIPGSKYVRDYCFFCRTAIRVILPRSAFCGKINLCSSCDHAFTSRQRTLDREDVRHMKIHRPGSVPKKS